LLSKIKSRTRKGKPTLKGRNVGGAREYKTLEKCPKDAGQRSDN